jgi:hypothetical protein
MAALVLLGSAVGLVMSTVQLNPNADSFRMDLWFYGRYMDQWWTILAVVGLTVLVRVKWPAVSAIALGASVIAGLGMLMVTVQSMPGDKRWIDMHVLGVSPWLRLDAYVEGVPQKWGAIVLTGLVLTMLVLALGLMRVWVLPILAALWMWLAIGHDVQGIDNRSGVRNGSAECLGLDLLPVGLTIGVDPSLGPRANMLVFAADPRPAVIADPLAPPDGIDVIYVARRLTVAVPAGVRVLQPTASGQCVAWVYPGEVADRLDAAGLLVDPET